MPRGATTTRRPRSHLRFHRHQSPFLRAWAWAWALTQTPATAPVQGPAAANQTTPPRRPQRAVLPGVLRPRRHVHPPHQRWQLQRQLHAFVPQEVPQGSGLQ